MESTDSSALTAAIQRQWSGELSGKARQYIGKFFERGRTGTRLVAKVQGNYGIYTVSVELAEARLVSACSCYIGKSGGCHHCVALAETFLRTPESFDLITFKERDQVQTLSDLESFLKGISLDALLQQLKSQGVTQKELAESLGMNPRHLSAIRTGERRNRYYNELGATKLACLWILEHLTDEP